MIKHSILSPILCAGLMLLPVVSSADKPDFSICDGLPGAAWGLCRAGVAAGCADDSGNSRACREIEDQYTEVTGAEPPWIAPPPVECTCDFSVVDKADPPWSPGVSNPVSFTCANSPYGGGRDVVVTDEASAGTENLTEILFYFESGLFHVCQTTEDGVVLNDKANMSVEEQAACAADAIAYGQALKAALGTDVDDACSVLLP